MDFWYQSDNAAKLKSILLAPLAIVFSGVSALRRWLYKNGIMKSYRAPVPVIVVGNINVGGTGKTPTVIAIVEYLKQQGYSPGVVSRGYGGKSEHYPYVVNSNSSSIESGDEPLLIYQRCRIPVMVDPNRSRAIQRLLDNDNVDCIVSDDGLQHYAMQRDIEIVVQDQQRLLGNGELLPAGPLREKPSRLDSVDLLVFNGAAASIEKDDHKSFAMKLEPGSWCKVRSLAPISVSMSDVLNASTSKPTAMAGIGNPKRFYQTLAAQGLDVQDFIELGDHSALTQEQLLKLTEQMLLMTEKDAMKYPEYAGEHWYYLPVNAKLSAEFYQLLSTKLANCKSPTNLKDL
ncbi:tetraacyldisaccharide 4'-kinase [Alginatibacterium sediminis]|uniref:Tetraacyldisaccharide 4'-kinase n=1 Tax=Alginatibacterium sediminis TaxID=2164068 RepID=A0A420EAS8_9ALTE|nr:tetraacyldisaccharide 4'-kinase [Alginatibacterium sediminis]RKF17798.1 tetraacyldisaccharide 4'-kinase [Alginatibacterium sediminis]